MTDNEEAKAVLRAAVSVIVEQISNVLYTDSHSWSERPCSTCRTITGITGVDFGCIRYAKQRLRQKGAGGGGRTGTGAG